MNLVSLDIGIKDSTEKLTEETVKKYLIEEKQKRENFCLSLKHIIPFLSFFSQFLMKWLVIHKSHCITLFSKIRNSNSVLSFPPRIDHSSDSFVHSIAIDDSKQWDLLTVKV